MRIWLRWLLAIPALDRLWPRYVTLLVRKRPMVVFGTGGIAEQFLNHCPLEPIAFLDNDKAKQGETFHGQKVHAPAWLSSLKDPFHVFIASSYHEPIRRQLLALGIDRSRISSAYPDPRLGLVGKAGLQVLIEALLIPLAMAAVSSLCLIRSFWACRVLAQGTWSGYAAFNPFRALNGCFYWAPAYLLRTYGRSGTAPNFALGDYPMSRFFYYCLPSLYLYRDLPILVPLVGMAGWWGAFWLWSGLVSPGWLIIVLGLLAISVSFVYNTFYVQNYNALGWLFFPLGLFALVHGYWLPAALIWLAASFASITVVVIAGWLAFVLAAVSLSPWPLLALAPAGLKLSSHFLPALRQGGGSARDAAKTIAQWIGLKRGKLRYRRIKHGGINHNHFLYFTAIHLQFLLFGYALTGILDPLFLAGMLIFAINIHVARFADIQTMTMLMASLAALFMLQQPNPWMLLPFWFLISPTPHRLFALKNKWLLPMFAPFDITPHVSACRQLLAPVPQGSRLLMAMDDPEGDYGRIYDGYRHIVELPVGIATEREIMALPTWHAISECNDEEAPGFWGRSTQEVETNMAFWRCNYVLVYQTASRELDPQWAERGFSCLSQMDWGPLVAEFPVFLGQRYEQEPPVWFLLQKQEPV